jgi:hypothetical protein
MGDELKNTNNQVGRAADGSFYAHWHGVIVNDRAGSVRKFSSERGAWAYLALCDKRGKLSD